MHVAYSVAHVSWLMHIHMQEDEASALIVAAENGHLKVVEILIAAKAQVDIQNKVHEVYIVIVI